MRKAVVLFILVRATRSRNRTGSALNPRASSRSHARTTAATEYRLRGCEVSSGIDDRLLVRYARRMDYAPSGLFMPHVDDTDALVEAGVVDRSDTVQAEDRDAAFAFQRPDGARPASQI